MTTTDTFKDIKKLESDLWEAADNLSLFGFADEADAAIPEHHQRRAQESDDRGMGAPTPVEGGRPVASRVGLSIHLSVALENAHQQREILRVGTNAD